MRASITTICTVAAQKEIRAFLNEFFQELPTSDSLKKKLVLATDEAIANAIIHGNDSDPEKSIQIDMDANEERITIELGDVGSFDDVMNLGGEKRQKDLKSIIKDKQKGGLGLKLIYTIMDIVTFYTMDDKSYCRMIKLFSEPPAPPAE